MRTWTLVAIVVVVAGALLAAGGELADPDIWWHAADGEFRIEHGGESPPISFYGHHGCEGDVREFVFGGPNVVDALAFRAGDMWALVALRAFLFAVIGACVVFARRRDPDRVVTLVLACLAMGALESRATVRPEEFAVALLAVTTAWLVTSSPTRLVHVAPGLILGALLARSHALSLAAPCSAVLVAGARFVVGDRVRAKWSLFAALSLFLGLFASPGILLAPVDTMLEGDIARALRFREYVPLPTLLAEGYRPPWLACAALLVVAAWASAASVLRSSSPIEAGDRATRIAAAGFAVVAIAATFAGIRGLVLFAAFAPAIAAGVVLPRTVRIAVVAAAIGALALIAMERVDDPVLLGKTPPDLTPSRLQPLGPARFLEDKHGLVFAPLHAGNWILFHDRNVDVVWTGRRTYTRTCGVELLHARDGDPAAFDAVDTRLHPDFVVVDLRGERALLDRLLERSFRLAYVDVVWAVFERPDAPAATSTLDATAAHVVEGINRPIDAPTLADALGRVCALLQRAAPDQSRDVCDAVRR